LLPPQAHKQHALCGDTANAIQQSGASHLAVHVSRSEKFADLAVRRLVECIRRPRQLARFEYACSDALDLLFLRHGGFCVKVLSEGVVALLAFSALNYLPVLLSLTLFITVLMTLSRSYRESEMVIWFGSGLSLLAWIRPVLLFAAPLVALVAVLSLFLSPWAIGRAEEYRRQMNLQDDVSRVAPGVFREAGSSDRVFFVE